MYLLHAIFIRRRVLDGNTRKAFNHWQGNPTMYDEGHTSFRVQDQHTAARVGSMVAIGGTGLGNTRNVCAEIQAHEAARQEGVTQYPDVLFNGMRITFRTSAFSAVRKHSSYSAKFCWQKATPTLAVQVLHVD